MLFFWAKLKILCVEKKRGYSTKMYNFFSIKFRCCEEEEKKMNNIKLLYFPTSDLVCINNKHIKIGILAIRVLYLLGVVGFYFLLPKKSIILYTRSLEINR